MRAFIAMAICLSIAFYAAVLHSESDEICCTWFNLKYIEGKFPQKVMFHYDGTFATYKKMTSPTILARGTYQIVRKWSDSEGCIWYKIITDDSVHGKRYQLARISQNGRKLEFICQQDNYPSEINTDAPLYCNYLRASVETPQSP